MMKQDEIKNAYRRQEKINKYMVESFENVALFMKNTLKIEKKISTILMLLFLQGLINWVLIMIW